MVKLKRVHGHMMTPGGSFWDVGAGVGKLVIAAAMMHNFEVIHDACNHERERRDDSCVEDSVCAATYVV